ncbi:hypothetical protein KC19_1G190300 [Ceratodon purpureus]|uniref:Uncharacterized protein n=1 Tax=Ceratodon purpureus TaxID=3225 RepID=A0A8T0J7L4_CERPU|nr:hypothetical protein KC19_1G190300 [Ceratodon purpureus]
MGILQMRVNQVTDAETSLKSGDEAGELNCMMRAKPEQDNDRIRYITGRWQLIVQETSTCLENPLAAGVSPPTISRDSIGNLGHRPQLLQKHQTLASAVHCHQYHPHCKMHLEENARRIGSAFNHP